MKSSVVFLLFYLLQALEGSVVILHRWCTTGLIFFSPPALLNYWKGLLLLSLTSCATIHLALSRQCTILYLHKKEECVFVCEWDQWQYWFASPAGQRRLLQWTTHQLCSLCSSLLRCSRSFSDPVLLWRWHSQTGVPKLILMFWMAGCYYCCSLSRRYYTCCYRHLDCNYCCHFVVALLDLPLTLLWLILLL